MTSVDRMRSARTQLQWQRIDPDGPGLHTPKREGDVGWDLEASETVTIYPGEAQDVPTNVRLHLPDDIWATINARSSIVRQGLMVEAGIIDTGYRGPLYALVRNMKPATGELIALPSGDVTPLPKDTVTIEKGTRIAQVIFHRSTPMWATEVPEIDLDSDRGEAGFGSTGA